MLYIDLIRLICEALRIDNLLRFQKLKDDEFLSSVFVLRPIIGGDGKRYEMAYIPFELVFRWLFTINFQNVIVRIFLIILNLIRTISYICRINMRIFLINK